MPTDKDVIDMFGAVVEEDADSGKFKREPIPMAALWADRKSLKFLSQAKRLDPRGFEALYQGNPAPEDGEYFKVSMLKGYKQHEFPRDGIHWYAASDHALSKKKENDASVLGSFAVDAVGDIWIPPDLFWERVETDRLVEEMISIMRRRKPLVWWAGGDNIKKSFAPFLRRRQKKEKVYTMVQDVPEVTDITLRARSIQGMMALGCVHFPTFAPWWQEAKNELLKFPNATHDDFVAFLAIIGMGLDMEVGIGKKEEEKTGPEVGTLAWVKQNSESEKKQTYLRLVSGGF
jgi:predicted phage terminase large subunit-like protein